MRGVFLSINYLNMEGQEIYEHMSLRSWVLENWTLVLRSWFLSPGVLASCGPRSCNLEFSVWGP